MLGTTRRFPDQDASVLFFADRPVPMKIWPDVGTALAANTALDVRRCAAPANAREGLIAHHQRLDGEGGRVVAIQPRESLDPGSFLAKIGGGRSITNYHKNQIVFSQGDLGDAVFYILKGKVKVAVVSERGKEAVIGMLGAGDFVGEGCLAGQPRRIATVTTMAESGIMRLE